MRSREFVRSNASRHGGSRLITTAIITAATTMTGVAALLLRLSREMMSSRARAMIDARADLNIQKTFRRFCLAGCHSFLLPLDPLNDNELRAARGDNARASMAIWPFNIVRTKSK